MGQADSERVFPDEDSLCESCGYPLRGLPQDDDCPECGTAVGESSPDKREHTPVAEAFSVAAYLRTFLRFFLSPSTAYRSLRIDGRNTVPNRFMAASVGLAAALWVVVTLVGTVLTQPRVIADGALVRMPAYLLGIFVLLLVLTYIEMLGVTAFSRRRGWRVPYPLAERVCCYASVGWLPGVLVGAVGYVLLDAYAAGHIWFEQLLGLVRVSWLFYGGLFVLSLLWFETLVWLGVRQVRFANAWPQGGPEPPQGGT